MKCPSCKKNGTDVIDSRQLNDGQLTKRRRQCNYCKERFTTYESLADDSAMMFIKENKYKTNSKSDIYKDLKRIHGESYPIFEDS